MLNQNQTPLVDALKKHREENPAYFCIPGHRYDQGISAKWLRENERAFLHYDLTEVEGLDDLHQPTGVIREAQELLADLYRAKNSYFLVNGTTCGNEAMLLAVLRQGDKILLPRNVHKSILQGLILCGATPVYFMPEWLESEGISGGIDPVKLDEMLTKHPDCKAFFMVNPTYYGMSSDLSEISKICKKHGALFLVDEAHGGHFYFSDKLPVGAIEAGADLCTQSFHKITGALTQSSVLHVASDRVDIHRVENALRLVQSTSPSYLLMASLDAARYELANFGSDMMRSALALAEEARERINDLPGMKCIRGDGVIGRSCIHSWDPTRLIIQSDKLDGYELQRILREKFRIDTELADFKNVLAIITHGNRLEDIERLVIGIKQISTDAKEGKRFSFTVEQTLDPPILEMTPREAYFAAYRRVRWEEAREAVMAELIAPYPPGIPMICPGERMTGALWSQIDEYRRRGCHIHGPEDESLQFVKIIDNNPINQ